MSVSHSLCQPSSQCWHPGRAGSEHQDHIPAQNSPNLDILIRKPELHSCSPHGSDPHALLCRAAWNYPQCPEDAPIPISKLIYSCIYLHFSAVGPRAKLFPALGLPPIPALAGITPQLYSSPPSMCTRITATRSGYAIKSSYFLPPIQLLGYFVQVNSLFCSCCSLSAAGTEAGLAVELLAPKGSFVQSAKRRRKMTVQ